MPDPVPDPAPPPAPPDGFLLFRWAVLIDRFRCGPAQIAALTDAQIDLLYFHARGPDGALAPPAPPAGPPAPPTREARLGSIAQLEALRLITPDRARELRDEVTRG